MRLEKYLDEMCGKEHGEKKRKRKGKTMNNAPDNGMSEAYRAGTGGEMSGLLNVLVGFPKDIKTMADNGNYKDALGTLKVLKTKVIPDLEKAIKAEMK